MNNREQNWRPSVTLLLLALCSGVAWRAELELRGGWTGLTWLGYFHWAVPICGLAFLVWVICATRVRHTWAFALCLLVFFVLAYLAVDFTFHLYFASGPSALGAIYVLGGSDFNAGSRRLVIFHFCMPLIWAFLSLAFCGVCRSFGVPITIRSALLSALLFVASWPLAIFVRTFFENRGSDNLIHALKSGFVVPFLIISLGLPFLRFSLFRRHKSLPSKTV